MVEKKTCSFCGGDIEPGTGLLFIRKDGNSFSFCSKKCKINQIELRRSPRLMKWTKNYIQEKPEDETEKPSTKKVRKVVDEDEKPLPTDEKIVETPTDKSSDEREKPRKGMKKSKE